MYLSGSKNAMPGAPEGGKSGDRDEKGEGKEKTEGSNLKRNIVVGIVIILILAGVAVGIVLMEENRIDNEQPASNTLNPNALTP